MNDELDDFFKVYYNKLQIIAKKICRNGEATDILNETVLKIYDMDKTKLRKLLDTNNLHHYILRIIKLSVISKTSRYQQKYNRVRSVELPRDIEFEVDEEPEYSDVLLLKLDEAIQKLPYDVRKVLEFRMYTDKTYEQFSKETYISPTMLWKLYQKALKQLKNELTEIK